MLSLLNNTSLPLLTERIVSDGYYILSKTFGFILSLLFGGEFGCLHLRLYLHLDSVDHDHPFVWEGKGGGLTLAGSTDPNPSPRGCQVTRKPRDNYSSK